LQLCIGNAQRAHKYFTESGRGLGHVTPTIFGIRSNMSLKLLELKTSNLIHGFVWAMPSRRTNKFLSKCAWPRSRDPYNFWQYGRYPSDSLASCALPHALRSRLGERSLLPSHTLGLSVERSAFRRSTFVLSGSGDMKAFRKAVKTHYFRLAFSVYYWFY